MSDVLINELIQFLFAVLTAVLTAAAPILLVKLYQWLGLKQEEAKMVTDQTIDIAKRLKVQNWLIRIEEWAATKIKAGDTTITAAKKLEELLKVAGEEGGIPIDEVVKLVHEELPKLGLGASGAPKLIQGVVETLPR